MSDIIISLGPIFSINFMPSHPKPTLLFFEFIHLLTIKWSVYFCGKQAGSLDFTRADLARRDKNEKRRWI